MRKAPLGKMPPYFQSLSTTGIDWMNTMTTFDHAILMQQLQQPISLGFQPNMQPKQPNLAWLDQRVDEIRVKL